MSNAKFQNGKRRAERLLATSGVLSVCEYEMCRLRHAGRQAARDALAHSMHTISDCIGNSDACPEKKMWFIDLQETRDRIWNGARSAARTSWCSQRAPNLCATCAGKGVPVSVIPTRSTLSLPSFKDRYAQMLSALPFAARHKLLAKLTAKYGDSR